MLPDMDNNLLTISVILQLRDILSISFSCLRLHSSIAATNPPSILEPKIPPMLQIAFPPRQRHIRQPRFYGTPIRGLLDR